MEVPYNFWRDVISLLSRETQLEIYHELPRDSLIRDASVRFQQRRYVELAIRGNEYRIQERSSDPYTVYEQLNIWIYRHSDVPSRECPIINEELFQHRIFLQRPRRIALICLKDITNEMLYNWLLTENRINVAFASALNGPLSEKMKNLILRFCQKNLLETFSHECSHLSRDLLQSFVEAFQKPQFREIRVAIDPESLWFAQEILNLWKTSPKVLSGKVVIFHCLNQASCPEICAKPNKGSMDQAKKKELEKILKKFECRPIPGVEEMKIEEENGFKKYVYEQDNVQGPYPCLKKIHMYFC
ncbi:hypothetical protein L596_023222 [Steinernema carpocapsae]|uniref:F-box domain-containing protein n=1 Tax=Steinernema carpocapsae TaxID=34508 RepID=A0A4V5ZZB4_STECR|nr:hypothetical protein L596_023222 [Steinernema carpocapsae]